MHILFVDESGSPPEQSKAALQPRKIEGTMAFMVESALPFVPTAAALASAQPDYDGAWSAFPKAVLPR